MSEHSQIGDFSRPSGVSVDVRGVQTETYYFPEEIFKLDKGVEVRSGRRHNKAGTVFMNNHSQTETERLRYSWFVVVFFIVALLNVWYVYVSFKVHYKLQEPVGRVEKSSHFLYPFQFLKHILPDVIVRIFTGE